MTEVSLKLALPTKTSTVVMVGPNLMVLPSTTSRFLAVNPAVTQKLMLSPNDHCVGDMTLLDVEGSTTYDQIPFTIVSQDTDSVTLKLQALWFDGVDVQYTQYSENFV
eukprot:Nitzschia sp. Nitz4//scaffold140_size61219//57811//58166//NITZ4_006442-RA/size61219-est2genome-gene-0.24-mRNA-1//1//CDS//3329536233//2647//frame0